MGVINRAMCPKHPDVGLFTTDGRNKLCPVCEREALPEENAEQERRPTHIWNCAVHQDTPMVPSDPLLIGHGAFGYCPKCVARDEGFQTTAATNVLCGRCGDFWESTRTTAIEGIELCPTCSVLALSEAKNSTFPRQCPHGLPRYCAQCDAGREQEENEIAASHQVDQPWRTVVLVRKTRGSFMTAENDLELAPSDIATVAMALAELALQKPGWRNYLEEIAEKFGQATDYRAFLDLYGLNRNAKQPERRIEFVRFSDQYVEDVMAQLPVLEPVSATALICQTTHALICLDGTKVTVLNNMSRPSKELGALNGTAWSRKFESEPLAIDVATAIALAISPMRMARAVLERA